MGINENTLFVVLGSTPTECTPVKILGGAAFAASSVISAGLAKNYYDNGGTDSSVRKKAIMDVIMGGVGFLGPWGFGISAGYFLLEAGTNGFGGYGDPTLTPKN